MGSPTSDENKEPASQESQLSQMRSSKEAERRKSAVKEKILASSWTYWKKSDWNKTLYSGFINFDFLCVKVSDKDSISWNQHKSLCFRTDIGKLGLLRSVQYGCTQCFSTDICKTENFYNMIRCNTLLYSELFKVKRSQDIPHFL